MKDTVDIHTIEEIIVFTFMGNEYVCVYKDVYALTCKVANSIQIREKLSCKTILDYSYSDKSVHTILGKRILAALSSGIDAVNKK